MPHSPLWAVVLVATLFTAAVLGYAFYAPEVGKTVAGQVGKATPEHPRGRAKVRPESYMASRPGPLTVKDVVRFYGLEDDTLPCTIEENYGSVPQSLLPTYERRPLKPGDEIIVCLD